MACSIEFLAEQALGAMPAALRALPQDRVPLRAFDMVGLPALRALLAPGAGLVLAAPAGDVGGLETLRGLDALADELAGAEHGPIMTMGKGGVGKTTVAAALAIGLVQRGKIVHLRSTDPAAQLPQATPVWQAAALPADLRRAGIEPRAWVLNKSVLAAGPHDPLLGARLAGERRQIERMADELAKRIFVVPRLTRPPIGFAELSRLVSDATPTPAAPP